MRLIQLSAALVAASTAGASAVLSTPVALARRASSSCASYAQYLSASIVHANIRSVQRIAAQLQQAHPEVPQWQQTAGMDDAARQAFLDRFQEGGQGIGFAVLGGAFSEGVDLPGHRLIGAFIATLGLPQVNPVNEQIRARMEAVFAGRGYDYTYLYPGLQKVVQAAGRVLRTPEDRGWLWLLDERYRRPEVRALLPGWWSLG